MGDCSSYIEPDIEQTPNESIIYTINWPARGLPENVTIADTEFLPAGTTPYEISNAVVSDNGLYVTFQLTGGVAGSQYSITNRITLSDDEVMEDTLIYHCVFQNTRKRQCVI